jgi:nucleotide-binding universal stress UspA family protein
MKTLLVCVDFSDVTDAVLAQACTLARAFDERVILLHVAATEPEFIGFSPGPESVRQVVAEGMWQEHARAQELKVSLEAQGLSVESLTVQGEVAEAILDHASRLEADMIVMGSHGHGALHNLLVGSACEHVLRKASCPVVVVPAPEK